MSAPDELLRAADIEAEYGVCESTLETWRSRGIGPAWFRLGPRLVAYRRSAVKAWIAEREQEMAS